MQRRVTTRTPRAGHPILAFHANKHTFGYLSTTGNAGVYTCRNVNLLAFRFLFFYFFIFQFCLLRNLQRFCHPLEIGRHHTVEHVEDMESVDIAVFKLTVIYTNGKIKHCVKNTV